MGVNKPASQSKEIRITNIREVSLGFPKKIAQDEARRCPQCAVATCLPGCPLGIDIPGFIRFLREGDAVSALARIKKDNPFPAICGRICPAPCELSCVFHQEGAAIEIRALERYASDFGYNKNERKLPIIPKGKKIAIVGSGPSGMAAAYTLAKEGFEVVIFESMSEAGGILRYGVPEIRLPQRILEEQFEEIKSLGVEIRTDIFVGRTLAISELFMQGFSVILLAVGAGVPDFVDMPGENLAGVYYAEEFLMRLQGLSKQEINKSANLLIKGSKTSVVGGGMAALDAARMAVRLGQEVHLIFPGLEEQMDVHPEDLKSALEEGIQLDIPVHPTAILGNEQGFCTGIACQRLDIVEGKETLGLSPVAGSDFTVEADTVILAHGRRPNHFLKTHLPQLKFNEQGTLSINELGQTSVDKIFACGNVVTGAGPVVDAIASGKTAAAKIAQYLGAV